MSLIKPGVPAPGLAARMGTEVVRAHGGVHYRELRARSLLNRCTSPRMPFAWTVNPYRGCAMGCRYCYATYTHEFMGIAVPEDFHTSVYVKVGGEAETARALAGLARRGERIALGTATDPYQPGEGELGATRRFLEIVAQWRNLRLGITTKGTLILRDLDLLKRIHERSELSVHVSLISLRGDLLRRLEPWAPAPEARLEVLRRLHAEGIECRLGLAPVLPGLTDSESDLDALLARVRETGVRRVFSNVLFLRSPTKEKYLRWLAREFPRLLEAYENAYRGRVYLGGRYRERLRVLLDRLRARHGFEPAGMGRESKGTRAEQLRLWSA